MMNGKNFSCWNTGVIYIHNSQKSLFFINFWGILKKTFSAELILLKDKPHSKGGSLEMYLATHDL